MHLVAVAPGKRYFGYDGKKPWGSFYPAFVVGELEMTLRYDYHCDAHLVTYVLPNCERQPRIRKSSLSSLDTLPLVYAFFCDVDNPGHAAWTEESFGEAVSQYASMDVLQTCGIYHTAHGARLVQPIVEPIPVDRVEPYIAGWFAKLEDAGIAVDWACKDWTRLFRMPNVKRDGVFRRAPFMDLSKMRPIEVEPLPEHLIAIRSKPRKKENGKEDSAIVEKGPRKNATSSSPVSLSPSPGTTPVVTCVVPEEWSSSISEEWHDRVPQLAAAILEVKTAWHDLFLALSGALLYRDVEPSELPAVVRAISLATADTRTEDRVTSARTTVENYRVGNPIAGAGALRRNWPGVADALDLVLPPQTWGGDNEWELAKEVDDWEAIPQIESAINAAAEASSRGLTLIDTNSGFAKTIAATCVAARRAQTEYVTEDAEGLRAPPNSKTAISVKSNALAIKVVGDLDRVGVGARRVFGPLSLLDENDHPVCKMTEVARPLVAGGQAMHWELCLGREIEPCKHSEGCRAKNGCEGPHNARVTVGTHALVGALDGACGTSGLLIIDEPPDLLEDVKITDQDMLIAENVFSAFDNKYVSAVIPAFQALRGFLGNADQDESLPLAEAIRRGAQYVLKDTITIAKCATGCDNDDLVVLAGLAKLDAHTFKAPPIRWRELQAAREDSAFAQVLGNASRVLGAIYKGLTAEAPAAARIELGAGDRRVIIVYPREQLGKALRRDGNVVAMSAGISVNEELYAKIVGYSPAVISFTDVDGAPIERIWLQMHGATRRHWLPGGKLRMTGNNLVKALSQALKLAKPATKVGIITMLPIELALRVAMDPDNLTVLNDFVEAGQPALLYPQIREELGKALHYFEGEIVLSHYHAGRGSNPMKDVDCFITLGDPWPNTLAVRNEVAFLDLDDKWEARMQALCETELEVAHGTLRAVQRTMLPVPVNPMPAKAIHIGMVKPGGDAWQERNVREVHPSMGRPRNEAAMTAEEFKGIVERLGGNKATAKKLGCSPKAVRRYLSGERSIPSEIALVVVELVA
ncbi:MAG: helix-turn-helix domain-containing protein [Myxococcota bacterium]|jgi:hypothetical protein|nr:helix-turn-helix domain-containing protein [Myxococcota bacterium]